MKKIAKFFKHIFIPHEHNDFKPHFFREFSIFSILIIIVGLLVISFGTNLYIKNADMTAAVLPAVLVDLTNNNRISNNELALARNPLLDTAAQLKAKDMATNGYFAHTSPAGITPWHWFSQVGYIFIYAGENLAVDFTESTDVENAWMNSPTHKKNILNNNFTEIGIATSEGFYQGRATTFVVQMFGTPVFPSLRDKKEEDLAVDTKLAVLPKKENTTENKNISNPVVKGESADIAKELEIITNTKDFISVKNTEVEGNQNEIITPVPKYSSWYQKFLFMMPGYADKVYYVLVWLVLVDFVLMIVIEIKKQHPKNILYGILILIIMLCFIYINRTMFMVDLFI